MKKTVTYVICILLSTLFIAAMPQKNEEKLYDNVIRLHILANSDSEDDQSLKLKVRDEILLKYSDDLRQAENIDEATSEVKALLEEITKTAETVIKNEGYEYTVNAYFDREYYPERKYENTCFPSGNYISLRLIIGEGKGQNWWCVLFPPLCLSTAYGDKVEADDSIPVGLTPEQYRIITKNKDVKYVLKFKMLEVLEQIFER